MPGPVTGVLAMPPARGGVYLAIGVTERDTQFGGGTLYCTILFFGPDGTLLGRHRKLMPTAAERLIWGEGDGSTLTVLDTEFGRWAPSSAGELHAMARMAMYAKGVNIYLAPTADPRDTWQASMRHIAFEGRCFVLGCNQFVTRDGYPEALAALPELAGRRRLSAGAGAGHCFAVRGSSRRAALRPRGNSLRGARSRGNRPGQGGFRRRRTLLAPGCLPAPRERVPPSPGRIRRETERMICPEGKALTGFRRGDETS